MNEPLGPIGSSPWAPSGAVTSLTADSGQIVTLIDGQTFCRSTSSGDVLADVADGLFVLDTRVLSVWQLRIDGHGVEPLAVAHHDPSAATFVGHVHPPAGKADAEIVIRRDRRIGFGMREGLTVQNFGLEATTVHVEMLCEVDFADLFEVKSGRQPSAQHRQTRSDPSELRFSPVGPDERREVSISSSEPASVTDGRWSITIDLEPRESWEVFFEIGVWVDGARIESPHTNPDDPHGVAPRLAAWRASLPIVRTDNADLAESIARSGADLGSLRIVDPDHPDDAAIAAGAPWYMTLFGRDSLLTAWMTMIADPTLARGVLAALARLQGTDTRIDTEEQPGKILHEVRFNGGGSSAALARGERYYGSVDSTPLFVMLIGEMARWGNDPDAVTALLPNADRALTWIEEFGDCDGDGYVEYEQATPHGLANQGWKDSWDAVRSADGQMSTSPIALCEVQAYVYAAYLARAHIAQAAGDGETTERYRTKASELQRRFNEDFWSERLGCYVLGLDGDKRQIDAVTSNMGHCLWTGIVDEEHAPLVAERLLSPDLYSGWGIRTLATSMAAFNPVSYHNGSVWPHDNALIASGLIRYGLVDQAHRVIRDQLAVAAHDGGRLPELFAGFDRTSISVPAAYPASCSPQAWAAAAPLLWLRVLLRLDPWAERQQVFVAPELPDFVRKLDVRGIRVGGAALHVHVEGDLVDVGLSSGSRYEVVRRPRPAMSSMFDRRTSP